MASAEAFHAPALYRCYYCQFESADNCFKYFDNRKVDQPRHQCVNCHKLFTLGSHGRPQGKTYAKKRNEDPAELKSLSRKCRHCGVADNALFKYYNNNNRLQPRFKCLSCGKQFQMRLMGVGDEMHLVHTSCNQRQATCRNKKGAVPEAEANGSNFGVQENYQASDDGNFMPLPSGMSILPENRGEDEQYASFLEDELTDDNEEAPNADPISYNANVENGKLLPENCGLDEQYACLLEDGLMDEDEQPLNAEPIPCNANVNNGGFLPELSTEDAQLLALLECESSTKENEQAFKADPTIRPLNEDDGLPLDSSGDFSAAENAEFLSFLEAGFLTNANEAPNVDNAPTVDELPPWAGNDADVMDFELLQTSVRADECNEAEMISESPVDIMDSESTSNPEVGSGTLLVETLAPTEPSDSWRNDTVMQNSFEPELPESCRSVEQFRIGPFEYQWNSVGGAW